MRGAFRSEPRFQAVFTSLNVRRFPVRTKFPGDNYQLECEAFFGQNRNSWRYFPVGMRGVCRSEPKCVAIVTSLDARYFAARTEIPGGIPQFKCEVFVSRNRNSWRPFLVRMRGVLRSGPKFLAVFASLNAGRFSVRTEIPGESSQFK